MHGANRSKRHPVYRLLGLDGLLVLLVIYAIVRGALADDNTFRLMWWVAAAGTTCGPAVRMFNAFRSWRADDEPQRSFHR